VAAFLAINVWLGMDEDGILVFSGGSSPNLEGGALLHLNGGGGFLGLASLGVDEVATRTVLGSKSRLRTEASRR
jgi:hypothetical protein